MREIEHDNDVETKRETVMIGKRKRDRRKAKYRIKKQREIERDQKR